MPVDLDELEARARPLLSGRGGQVGWWDRDDLVRLLSSDTVTTPIADAIFIAACSPDAVLALIERARKAEAALEHIRRWAKQVGLKPVFTVVGESEPALEAEEET